MADRETAAAGGYNGITPEFREASEHLDEELNRLKQILFVAHRLAHEIEVTPEAEALTEMVELAERATESARAAKDDAWRAQGGT